MSTGHRVGDIVTNPRKPEWGPGKVLAISGGILTVYFRDDSDSPRKDGTREVTSTALERAALQSDQFLDNLPLFNKGVLGKPRCRMRLGQCLDRFRREYPGLFDDPAYIGGRHSGERRYKEDANKEWVRSLDAGQARELLQSGSVTSWSGGCSPWKGWLIF